MPVPAIKVRPPAMRSASLEPMIEPGPGLHNVELPEPKLQTICLVRGLTSITRLLNWSVISKSPARLNRLEDDGRATECEGARETAKAAVGTSTNNPNARVPNIARRVVAT